LEGAEVAALRVLLSEVAGIIEVSRHALASDLATLDGQSVIDALNVAYRIVDGGAEALEKGESPPAEADKQDPTGSSAKES